MRGRGAHAQETRGNRIALARAYSIPKRMRIRFSGKNFKKAGGRQEGKQFQPKLFSSSDVIFLSDPAKSLSSVKKSMQ